MAGPTVKPLGALPGTVVPIGALVTPGGDRGPAGVAGQAGPTAVSTQAGNRATLGSDGLLYVPPYPYADATQGGLMRQLSGNVTDYQGGDNSCHPLTSIPPATTSIPGLLKVLSGSPTDFVGGDNACHNLPGYIEYGDLIPPASPSTWDDEFTGPINTTVWTLTGTKPGPPAATIQQQAPTYMQQHVPFNVGGVTTLKATKTISSTSVFMWQTKVRLMLMTSQLGFSGASVLNSLGEVVFGLTAGTKGIAISLYTQSQYNGSAGFFYNDIYVFGGASGGTALAEGGFMYTGTDLRMRIGIQSGNLVAQVSPDGYNWMTVYSEVFATGPTLGGSLPTGLYLQTDNAGSSTGFPKQGAVLGAWDYVRMIS